MPVAPDPTRREAVITRARGVGDRGAGTAEYLGIAVIAVLLVTAVVGAVGTQAGPLRAAVENALCSIVGEDCSAHEPAPVAISDGGSGGPDSEDGWESHTAAPEPVDPDRDESARDARDSRRDDRNREDPEPGPEPTSPGNPDFVGLGDPVPGEDVPVPEPPPWSPADTGAGSYGSDSAGAGDHTTKFAAETAANAMSGAWPHAARNLLHFLGNSGEPLEQDVDRMLADVPALAEQSNVTVDNLAATAAARAQELGADGPITFPVSSPWEGFYIYPSLSQDWFYALGGITYSVVGQVTVHPPSTPGGGWTYEATTSVVVRDQYNWDGDKSTQIGPFEVTDEQLARLHRAGLAQEFSAVGQSATTSRKGP